MNARVIGTMNLQIRLRSSEDFWSYVDLGPDASMTHAGASKMSYIFDILIAMTTMLA